MSYVDIVFDGPPSEPAPRLVEVEDSKGKSIRFGEWVSRGGRFWALRIQQVADQRHLDALAAVRVAYERALDDDDDSWGDRLLTALGEALNPVTGPDGEALR